MPAGFNIGMGILFIALGALSYWMFAALAPNPFAGFRYSYTLADREIWERTNRLGGILLAIAGALLIAAQLVIRPGPEGSVTLFLVWIAVTLPPIIWITYSRARQWSREKGAVPTVGDVTPFPPPWGLIAVPLILAALAWVGVAVLWPHLPDTLATHFNGRGVPDGWMPKGTGLLLLPFLQTFIALLLGGLIWWGSRHPGILAGGGLTARAMAGLLGWTSIVLGLFLGYAYSDTLAFNLTGKHLLPMEVILIPAVLLGPAILIYVALKWKDPRKQKK